MSRPTGMEHEGQERGEGEGGSPELPPKITHVGGRGWRGGTCSVFQGYQGPQGPA